MSLPELLSALLLFLGAGFLVANVRVAWSFIRARRLQPTALLTWKGSRPPFYSLLMLIGVVLGLLVAFKLVVQGRSPLQVFGEGMMFLYYACAIPLSLRIARGFYQDGIWIDSGFVPYSKIGGLTWREGDQVTLVVVDRIRCLARSLVVPQEYYSEARRLLHDHAVRALTLDHVEPFLVLVGLRVPVDTSQSTPQE